MVAHGQDVGLFTQAQQQRAVVHQRPEIQRRQRIGQLDERLGAALTVGDQLGDHGIVIGADLIACGDAGVDAHTNGPVQPVDGAACGQKTGRHILGVEARLHRMAAQHHFILSEWQRLALGHGQLPGHQILSGHRFGDGMLYLQPGVHLHKEELILAEQKFDGASPLIVDGLGSGHGCLPHGAAQSRRNIGGGRLFDHLLMASLQRAVPVP